MLGKKACVAEQIKCIQPKAVETHCHGHSLNLSVKDISKSNRLLSDVMSTVTEITTLVKYSPKREQLLGTIKDNIEQEHGDLIEESESLTKFCVTRWTVQATDFQKVIINYQPL